MSKLKNLLTELRRRRVFRMTAIYIVASWVVVQVASETFPAINIPEGAIRYVWVAVLIGFPVALLFSWKYDLTPAGIRRTPAADQDAAAVSTLTRVDYGILTALGLVILATVFSVGQRLVEVQTEIAQAPTTREIDPNSIAVLPLENLSPSPDDAYFAAGVHNSLITSLSKITALMVTSGTSTRRINAELSVPQIGRKLGVAKLVEGSVLMDGDRVRVIVQLVDAASDLSLWADTFERDVTDIIALQNEVARTIANVIEVRLTPGEEATLAKSDPVRPEIYRMYLKGMYQFRQETPAADRRGVEILEEVVRQDPTSALAHAGLAYGYAILGHTPFPGDAYPKAKSAADKALQLDPELAQAHLALGMYRVYYEWDFESAERAFKRAIELNPSLTEAHYHLAWSYEVFGSEREEESLLEGERTRELDPLSPFMVGWLADQYREACRYEKALGLAREAIRLDPEHPIGWLSLGLTYAELGEFDEAIDAHRHLAKKPHWAWSIGMTYAAAGLEDKAREVTAALEQNPGTELPLALIYARMGDRESALHWIAEAETKRVPWYPSLLGWFPAHEVIADDPRLQARAAALNLPDPRTMNCGS
ncbi:MAG: tetratricopeptide repeat protein [Woeseiaceae bacterium]|nr:tetratricopeptide repeat protein [Woeseiaceae bacterium]MDX2607978.1 tetratricopeptide repeat protein [Woeseiaceae bacterium]